MNAFRFPAVMRIDRILNQWAAHHAVLAAQGYAVDTDGNGASMKEVRRFLADWIARMKPVYMAVSLEDTFLFPADDVRTRLFREAVLPTCQEFHLPMSLMIGVRRQINPALRLAGDGVGRADMHAVQNIAIQFPDNRFLVSMLSRENQHEFCVIARKFRNLLPFGCWWFLQQHLDCGRDDARTAGDAGHAASSRNTPMRAFWNRSSTSGATRDGLSAPFFPSPTNCCRRWPKRHA